MIMEYIINDFKIIDTINKNEMEQLTNNLKIYCNLYLSDIEDKLSPKLPRESLRVVLQFKILKNTNTL